MSSARTVEVAGLSDAWLRACRALLGCHGHEASHLVVRMGQPLSEDAHVRASVDQFLASAGAQPIDEVRNTIFPAALAEVFTDPDELIAEYMEDYDTLRALGSTQGTYFGRICGYPHPDGTITPQLANTIAKLSEAHQGTRWRARYELNIYADHRDHKKKRNFFPCMAHLSYQLGYGEQEVDRLDCTAVYRYQDLILKGYGNFLGVAQLQRYVADATGFIPGELIVVAGHAQLSLDGSSRARLETLLETHGITG